MLQYCLRHYESAKSLASSIDSKAHLIERSGGTIIAHCAQSVCASYDHLGSCRM